MTMYSLDHFPPSVKEMAERSLHIGGSSTTNLASAQVRADGLEQSARSQLLALADSFLMRQKLEYSSSSGGGGCTSAQCMDDIVQFICAATELCHLIVTLSNLATLKMESNNNRTIEYDLKWIGAAEGMGPMVSSLPFSLLEDAFDTLPISKCKKLWMECLERQSHLLCDDVLFSSGSKLTMLRISNKILTKKLLRERDSEFAGRVLMFLANKFQLSERSGLNIQGKYNLENVTNYEDEGTFEQVKSQQKDSSLLNVSLPSEEKDNLLDNEEGMQAQAVDYNLYSEFWGLQEFLCNPNCIIQDIISATDSHSEKFDKFISGSQTVLDTFESLPFPVEDSKQTRLRWLARKRQHVQISPVPLDSYPGYDKSIQEQFEMSIDRPEEIVSYEDKSDLVLRHQKYLTSSQLLCLQLRDPLFRCQVLSQILIVCSYLIHRQELDDGKREHLDAVSRRVEQCLSLIPPSGQEQIQLLLNLFHNSERFWRKWKEEKCKSFEKYEALQLKANKSNPSVGEKRKRQLSSDDRNIYEELRWRGKLDSLPRDVTHMWHKKEVFFADYVDACDPENDIEADYHPKNDPLFCWRALRVLSVDNLDLFNLVDTKTGDFERVVREVWKQEMNIVIPGEAPCVTVVADEQPALREVEETDEKLSMNEIEKVNEDQGQLPQTELASEVDDGVDMVVAYIFDDKPNVTDTSNSEADSNENVVEFFSDDGKIEKADQEMIGDVERSGISNDADVTMAEVPSSNTKLTDQPDKPLTKEDSKSEVNEVEEGEIELGKKEEETAQKRSDSLRNNSSNDQAPDRSDKKSSTTTEPSRHRESPRKDQVHRPESSTSSRREPSHRSGGQKNESSNYSHRRHDYHRSNPSSGGSRGAARGNRGPEISTGRVQYRDSYGIVRPDNNQPHGSNIVRGSNHPVARARSQGGGRR